MKALKYIKPLILAVVLIAVDQITKLLAIQFIKPEKIVLIDGVLELNYTENSGAAFGVLKDGTLFLTIISIVLICGIGFYYFKVLNSAKFNIIRIFLIFIFAGAIGNLIDRIIRHFVVDFIYFKLIDFPVFNVADIYVTCSVIALAVYAVFFLKDDDKKKKDTIEEK